MHLLNIAFVVVCLQEDIENSKKDWELARLKALKEEEERRAELEDDEMLYTYLRDDAQVKRHLDKPLKRGPGRPPIRMMAANSSLLGGKPPKTVAKKIKIAGKRVGRKPLSNGGDSECKNSSVNKVSVRGRPVKVRVKVENEVAELPDNGSPISPSVGRKPSVGRGRRGNVGGGKVMPVSQQNGDLTPHDVKVVETGRKRGGGGAGRGKGGRGGGTGRGRGRPRLVEQSRAQSSPPRTVLNVPAMSSLPSPASGVGGSPPRIKSPATVTNPILPAKDSNVPPPWSNPNLVIRTRRASLHSPVAVSGNQVIQGVTSATQQQSFPAVVSQTPSVVQLISPTGSVVALAATQPRPPTVQLVSTARVRPSISGSAVASPLSLTGTRVLTSAPTQHLVNAAGLSGSILRMPDGSTAVLGQLSTSLIGAQQASPTVLVSTAGQAGIGTRALLATNLHSVANRTILTPRIATQTQVVAAPGVRTVQLGPSLSAPVTLRGVGVASMPVGVNFVKAAGSGVQIPIVSGQGAVTLRGGQIIQTANLGQVRSPQSFVLITPRVRTPVQSCVPVSIPAQTPPAAAAAAPAPQDVNSSVIGQKKGNG